MLIFVFVLRLHQYLPLLTQWVFFFLELLRERSVSVRITMMLDCMWLINFSTNNICVKPHEFFFLIAQLYLIFSLRK